MRRDIPWSIAVFLQVMSCSGQTSLPDAPKPVRDLIHPWALSVSTSERFQTLRPSPDSTRPPYIFENTVGVGVEYHPPINKLRFNIEGSYAIQTGNKSVAAGASYKLWEAGRAR